MDFEGLREATGDAIIMRLMEENKQLQKEIQLIEKNTDYWADKARELQAENQKLRNYIIAAYNAQDDHEQHNIIVNAMDYLERAERGNKDEGWSDNDWVKEQGEHDD